MSEEQDGEPGLETLTGAPPALAVEGLTKSFADQPVLEGVNLRVPKGRIFVLMGISGSGKSVFLKHLIRLLKPESGRILVENRELAAMDRDELVRYLRRVGMVFQGSALFDSLSAGENVAFPLREHSELDDGRIRARAEEMLERVGLEGAYHKLPAELSGGMRKRAGIARGLALRPDFLYFDEPTSGLDPITSAVIEELIVETHREFGYTGVVITHSVSTAQRLGHKVALLWNGRIRAVGTFEDLAAADDPIIQGFLKRDPHVLELV